MIMQRTEIKLAIRRLTEQYTGNAVDSVVTYDVKNRRVILYMEKTPSGNNVRYSVGFYDYMQGTQSKCDITFGAYPKKVINHSNIEGTLRVLPNYKPMYKNFRDVLLAIAELYGYDVCSQNM